MKNTNQELIAELEETLKALNSHRVVFEHQMYIKSLTNIVNELKESSSMFTYEQAQLIKDLGSHDTIVDVVKIRKTFLELFYKPDMTKKKAMVILRELSQSTLPSEDKDLGIEALEFAVSFLKNTV